MDITNYFEVVSTEDRVFHFKIKNFWDDNFVKNGGPVFWDSFVKGVDSFGKKKFVVLADMSAFKAPSEETKKYIGKGMKYALENGLHKSVELIEKAVPKMGVDQAAKEVSNNDFRVVTRDKTEALELIKKLKSEIPV